MEFLFHERAVELSWRNREPAERSVCSIAVVWRLEYTNGLFYHFLQITFIFLLIWFGMLVLDPHFRTCFHASRDCPVTLKLAITHNSPNAFQGFKP